MSEAQSDLQFVKVARALAAPRRLQILKQVGQWKAPRACNTLLDVIDISAATLSHHVKALESAGLPV